jgi:transposase
MTDLIYIGIDVAKRSLDIAQRPTGKAFQVRHDEAGIADLVQRLVPLRPARSGSSPGPRAGWRRRT